MTGLELISQERQRQVSVEGFTQEHDDKATDGQLALAARCYAAASCYSSPMPLSWPWLPRWWKPEDKIRNLVKAGALIAAEIDRLQRQKGGQQ